MNSAIKDALNISHLQLSQPFGVDEEKQLIAFEAQDLKRVINSIIQVCADCCIDPESRAAILELSK